MHHENTVSQLQITVGSLNAKKSMCSINPYCTFLKKLLKWLCTWDERKEWYTFSKVEHTLLFSPFVIQKCKYKISGSRLAPLKRSGDQGKAPAETYHVWWRWDSCNTRGFAQERFSTNYYVEDVILRNTFQGHILFCSTVDQTPECLPCASSHRPANRGRAALWPVTSDLWRQCSRLRIGIWGLWELMTPCCTWRHADVSHSFPLSAERLVILPSILWRIYHVHSLRFVCKPSFLSTWDSVTRWQILKTIFERENRKSILAMTTKLKNP